MIKSIIGYGGFAREVYHSLDESEKKDLVFFVEDEFFEKKINANILPLSLFNPKKYETIVAIGDIETRCRIVNSLPKNTIFYSHIHNSVQILDPDIKIGEGSIICAGTILTTNISIGKHSQLNLLTTVGHDSNIGDYFTTAPGTKISGNCEISNNVYFGTNSSVRQKIKICSGVTIGMNAAVVKDINESGIYVGIPAQKLKK